MKKVKVSRVDIVFGEAKSKDRCPVALALLREGGFSRVQVGRLNSLVATERTGKNQNWKRYTH